MGHYREGEPCWCRNGGGYNKNHLCMYLGSPKKDSDAVIVFNVITAGFMDIAYDDVTYIKKSEASYALDNDSKVEWHRAM